MAEHDVDLVGISVQQVLHGLGSAVGGVLAGQSVQNGDAGLVAGGLIALAAHIGGVVALLAIDDDGVGALTCLFSGPQAAFLRGVYVGGAHEAGLTLDAHIGIDGQNGDAADGAGKRTGSGAGVIGSDDDGIAACADLLLNHRNLLLDLALSAGAHHVGGGIPIIRPLNQALTADEITKITGIMNGTTNYILTKMSNDGSSYEEVLNEAQALGYAERNPEADVEGYDACRKIAILTSLADGRTVNFEEITTEGITKISNEDFAYARKLNSVIKLLATSYRKDGKVYAITAPFLIDTTHPLYNVNGVLNGIYVNGNMVGDVMFFGAGAGKLPTASAVVGDIIDCVKHKGTNVCVIWDDEKLELAPTRDEVRSFFVRVKGNASDTAMVKEQFGDVEIITVDGLDNEFGFITDKMTEEAFDKAAANVDMISRIRIDDTKLQ